jgi:hypothetical protein
MYEPSFQTMSDQKKVVEVVAEDPLSGFPVAGSIKFQLVNFGGSDAVEQATSVINWEFFNGAVMGFFLKSEASQELVGTAIIVAPGLAITATHNLADVADKLQEGPLPRRATGFRIWSPKDGVDDNQTSSF